MKYYIVKIIRGIKFILNIKIQIKYVYEPTICTKFL